MRGTPSGLSSSAVSEKLQMVRLFPAPWKTSPNRSNYIPPQTLAPQRVARQSQTFFLKKATRFDIDAYVQDRAASLPLSPFSNQHSAISIQQSAFSNQHSAISIQQSAFSNQHSAISIQHSAFSNQHSAFSFPSPVPCILSPAPCPLKKPIGKNSPQKASFSSRKSLSAPERLRRTPEILEENTIARYGKTQKSQHFSMVIGLSIF
jgi:hypothetical protein